jgi:hypothetical protein
LDDTFNTEYERHSPFDEPVCKLIKSLRSDTQHAHLPVIQQRVDYTSEPEPSMTCRLVVSRSYLARLDLSADTKQYLADLQSDPPIQDLVDLYTRHVEEFVAWFIGAYVGLRADDLTSTLHLRRRAYELAEPIRRAFGNP